jgi:hypothetical protein
MEIGYVTSGVVVSVVVVVLTLALPASSTVVTVLTVLVVVAVIFNPFRRGAALIGGLPIHSLQPLAV